jgi:hypothetical protein
MKKFKTQAVFFLTGLLFGCSTLFAPTEGMTLVQVNAKAYVSCHGSFKAEDNHLVLVSNHPGNPNIQIYNTAAHIAFKRASSECQNNLYFYNGKLISDTRVSELVEQYQKILPQKVAAQEIMVRKIKELEQFISENKLTVLDDFQHKDFGKFRIYRTQSNEFYYSIDYRFVNESEVSRHISAYKDLNQYYLNVSRCAKNPVIRNMDLHTGGQRGTIITFDNVVAFEKKPWRSRDELFCSGMTNFDLLNKSFTAIISAEAKHEFDLEPPYRGYWGVLCRDRNRDCFPQDSIAVVSNKLIAARQQLEKEGQQQEQQKNREFQERQRLAELRKKEELERCFGSSGVGICIKNITEGVYICDRSAMFPTLNQNCWVNNPLQITVAMSIRNNLNRPVKDINIRCSQIAKSGTVLRNSTDTVYNSWQPRDVKDYKLELLKHNQWSTVNCQVISFN